MVTITAEEFSEVFYTFQTTNQELSRVETNKDEIKGTSRGEYVRETPHAAANNVSR